MMLRYLLPSLVLCGVLATGCSNGTDGDGSSQDSDQSATNSTAEPSAENAKAHVQKYVDRLLGGDETVKGGLLGFEAHGIIGIETIDIVSGVPAVLADGTDVADMFSVRLRINGTDDSSGRKVEKVLERKVMYSAEDGYSIMGAEF